MMIRCFLVAISLVWQVESGSDARAQLLSHTISDDIPEALFQLPLASEKLDERWTPQTRSLLEPRQRDVHPSRPVKPSRPLKYTEENRLCDGACISARACEHHQGTSKGQCANGNICCHFAKSCGGVSREKITFFHSPYYPNSLNGSLECSFRIYPSETTCALKIHFERFQLKRAKKFTKTEKCVDDIMFVLNSAHGATEGVCEMENHTAIVEIQPASSHPVIILFVTQSSRYSWNLKISQINCKKLEPWKNLPECGKQLMYEPNEYDTEGQVAALESPYSISNPLASTLDNIAESPQTFPYIVNGKDAEVKEFPWQVSLQLRTKSSHRCGATILNERFIITAAHCLYRNGYISKDKIKVIVGDYILATDKDGEHEELSIEDIIVHYNYNPSESHMNDIAIIKVNQTITFSDTVQPVCLIDAAYNVYDKKAVVSGWGRLNASNANASATRLQKLNIKTITNEQCRKMVKQEYEKVLQKNLTYEDIARTSVMGISDTQICGLPKLNSSVCFGDSGGPLLIQNEEDGRFFQAGVVSYGLGKCRTDRDIPGSYTNVQKYLNFIAIATMET